MSKRDYYDILGVEKNSSDEELKKAYRKMARQHHPDLHPGDAQKKDAAAAAPRSGAGELNAHPCVPERRAGLLDAVVFSGGEPTVDRALPTAIRDARELGFAVGLHTAGAYPARLKALLPLVDWVGMDVKADLAGYDRVTRTHASAARAVSSIELLLASGVEYELRTTYHPALIHEVALVALADWLAGMGVRRYALQALRPQGCDAPGLGGAPVEIPPTLVREISRRFTEFALRAQS